MSQYRLGNNPPPPLVWKNPIFFLRLPSATHLGHELNVDGKMEFDAKMKKFKFIENTTEVRETFSFAHPVEIIHAMKVYCCDHYGSVLWNLNGKMANQVFRVWDTAVKLAWGILRQAHSYFLDSLSGWVISARSDVLSRYAGFISKLKCSASSEVTILANIMSRDLRLNTGRNVRLVEMESGLDLLSTSKFQIRQKLRETKRIIPETSAWRVPYLSKLLEQKQEHYYAGESSDQITCLIDSLCIN